MNNNKTLFTKTSFNFFMQHNTCNLLCTSIIMYFNLTTFLFLFNLIYLLFFFISSPQSHSNIKFTTETYFFAMCSVRINIKKVNILVKIYICKQGKQ